MSKASGFFVEPFLSGKIQIARRHRSVIRTPEPEKRLSPLGFSRPNARAQELKQFFAELFFKKATSSSP